MMMTMTMMMLLALPQTNGAGYAETSRYALDAQTAPSRANRGADDVPSRRLGAPRRVSEKGVAYTALAEATVRCWADA